VRPSPNQIPDLMDEIEITIAKGGRILITTITKRMAEELSKFFDNRGVKSRYIHSEVKTLDRVEILRELRLGIFDVLVGVNLLREGLDLPEVSLVAIMDADKEGFLRNHRSLIQTIGRAARNEDGRVIMYADRITDSMQKAIEETNRRRSIQIEYNLEHGITPTSVGKGKESILSQTRVADAKFDAKIYADLEDKMAVAAEPAVEYKTKAELQKQIDTTKKQMEKAAKDLEFVEAARLRDEWQRLKEVLSNKY